MNRFQQKRIAFILFFIFIFGFFQHRLPAGTFFGEIQTGLIELKDFSYPVYIFIPPNIKPERKYPLMISIPNPGESPEENMALWMNTAKRQTWIVVVPSFQRIEDVPYDFDRWFFQMKAIVENQYPVNPEKVYLIGNEEGAHYAAYLGVNFPEEFSSIGLLAGSWVGRLEKLMTLGSSPAGQIPFFVALKENQGDLYQATEKRAFDFTQKGYPVRLVRFEKDEEFLNSTFKKELLQWLESKAEEWEILVQKDNKTFKERARRAIKKFFEV